ncbi:gamma-glutamyl-gamma-aminobutyrate hydrolase family protein [Streptococcus dysgalactiae]|uniref:Gamma-glutamyl-gamma-aminobutyrate hydrolase family protein n=1 Tax=Streptococcus dysgalactiae subsp. dysgalactiae TaxID=99822 RepID=A0A9X7RZ05_STRDY|nr:gamma-glutamyl-gamma-aminobutyrate hydrolase family protein [Streptococcus dysgalactiae]QGG98123.1 gamma-glutamyl-gamma-aminobutyrate hydrolase family protein [Streptococcus dysgalactiae subsp. dysgalactiae]QGH02839.1 gamma-glutamyl-gamma-aminobutyrate hydrolase family protein [Streptococcus dysgalactiae subsp. dysgalactiae]
MSTKKIPIIGISASVIVDSGGMFPGYHRSYVNEDYVSSVCKNDAIPMILPISEDVTILDGYINTIDGLILSGGHDICPLNYGEEPSPKLGDTFPARDAFDFALLERAVAKEIPILGICRGNQIINVKNGGNLWQDLSYVQKPLLKHWQEHHPDWATHSVDLEKGSLLHRIFETDTLMVNSFHHQIIKEVAPGFKVAARAKDGVIEAIEHESYPFMIGVQWHPEMLHQSVPIMNRLFQALIQATAHEMTDINLDQAVKVS